MIRVEKCPVCESEDLQVLKKYQFALPGIKEYNNLTNDITYEYERLWILFEKILKNRNPAKFEATFCKSCGLIFTNPRFTGEEINAKYKTISELESAVKRAQKLPALKTGKRSKRIYSLLSRLLENRSKAQKVLDYGGAQGYNLLPFIEAGNSGYLLDHVSYNHPNCVIHLGKDVDDLQTNEYFDVILLCHTLEHVTEPRGMINALSYHLTEKGLLYVEVPLGCWNEWKELNEPLTHVNFFSEQSLLKCLLNEGLNIIHLSTTYQWVTHGKMWCVNIVGSKHKGHTITKFKTTRQQMENPYYYLKPLVNNPRQYFTKIIEIFR